MRPRAAAKSSGVGWPALAGAVVTGSGGASRGGSAGGGGGTGTDGGAAAVEAALRFVRTTRAETGGLDSVTASSR